MIITARPLFVILVALCLVSFVVALSSGSTAFGLTPIWQALHGDARDPAASIIMELRLPRAVLAFVTGDTLSSRVKEFLESCGRPFVEKPITPAEVRDLVARVAKSH